MKKKINQDQDKHIGSLALTTIPYFYKLIKSLRMFNVYVLACRDQVQRIDVASSKDGQDLEWRVVRYGQFFKTLFSVFSI
jgi:hypothetical protein